MKRDDLVELAMRAVGPFALRAVLFFILVIALHLCSPVFNGFEECGRDCPATQAGSPAATSVGAVQSPCAGTLPWVAVAGLYRLSVLGVLIWGFVRTVRDD